MPINGQRVHIRQDWHRPEWHDHAACRGHQHHEWWFPTNREGHNTLALAICKSCPVQTDCLRHAIDADEFDGIWGGATAPERQQMRTRRLRGLVV